MFWNKKSTSFDNFEEPIVKTKNDNFDYLKEFHEIDSYYDQMSKEEDFLELINEGYSSAYRWSNNEIIRRYRSIVRQNTKNKKLNEQMSGILSGNKEWWGHAQQTFEKTRQQLERVNLHLELEKNNFLELYKKNRELESEVYLLKRELELRGRGWNDEQILRNKE